MATFYIDLVNGNNANTGLDWANAWKTLANGATPARIAAGDVIRISKTPDPVSLGTATWTHKKVGNSITFDTEVTKFITDGTAGWVTSSSTTVTNNQSTAYIFNPAVSCATSADAALMYKNLGSVIDYSSHQQISFWFRPAAAFDCSTTQNMTIQLCSDTNGTVVVDSLVMPKYAYVANYWYPITIDKGAALGTNIQSISIITTAATSATFYFDEFFASPANGLTLTTLIKDNSESWFPIKRVRGADVWLFATYYPTTAAGASVSVASYKDTAWTGTSGNFVTYCRNTLSYFIDGQFGPQSGTVFNPTKAGTATASTKALITFSGGWDTQTNLRDGVTVLDGLIQLSTGFSIGASWNRLEDFVFVRYNNALSSSASYPTEYKNLAFAGCGAATLGGFANAGNFGNKIYDKTPVEIPFWNSGALQGIQVQGSPESNGYTINVGKIWGSNTPGNIINYSDSIININELTTPAGNTNNFSISGMSGCTINVDKMYLAPSSTQTVAGAVGLTVANSVFNIVNIGLLESGNTSSFDVITNSCSDSVLNIETFAPPDSISNMAIMNTEGGNNVCKIGTYLSSGAPLRDSISYRLNSKAQYQDWGGVAGAARVYFGLGLNTPIKPYIELQGDDVRTVGNKAWKYYNIGNATLFGYEHTLHFATAAVEANKLVTVSCWVKNTSTGQIAGIRTPGSRKLIPGLTTDQNSTNTVFGAWQQLSYTFTPTADCVIDVVLVIKMVNSMDSVNIVWDDLSITQVA